jgi:hypothetical protein
MTMATFTTTTPAGVLKGALRPHSTLTPVALRFRDVLRAMDDLIAAERDLDGYSGQDPALDAWIRDAERARRILLDAINELGALPKGGDGDAQLLRVARLFRVVMVSDDPGQVAYLRTLAAETDRFLLPWGDPLHFKLNQLILGGLARLERFAALDDPDPDDSGHQLDAAVVMPTPTF